jgi:hypothetical protein
MRPADELEGRERIATGGIERHAKRLLKRRTMSNTSLLIDFFKENY